ncbi:MAG: phosphate acyltransferase PlsX [Clostridia bacterium]|nr:phosphate acyltransferase PlsX [Clostridia bacterium]
MIKIVVDCYGGDYSPSANVEGAVEALGSHEDLSLVLTGDEQEINKELSRFNYDKARITVVNAPKVISHEVKPTVAIKDAETSMAKAMEIVRKEDDVAGLVSLGSTGALLAGAFLKVGRLKNVLRPAFCPILPTMDGKGVGICDSGANAECTPDYLKQFAIMGSKYLEITYGFKSPRVALLNIGTEEDKGDRLRLEAYELLKNTECINFVGNMESRNLLTGELDLVVCDGFSGNVLLKSTEGACLEMLKMLKRTFTSSLKNKIGALFLKKSILKTKDFMDYRNYGGAVMLGTKKIVVKCHGNGVAKTVANCIDQAYKMQAGGLNEAIEKALEQYAPRQTSV